ncbi:protein ECT2 [Chironomus tepperi]|uniref:protein ECT2 n=1 Tax=Chironomus tepperi TaxID=113505 RepID=UPI00391FC7CC
MENETQKLGSNKAINDILDIKEQQMKRICLVGSLVSDENIKKVAESFNVPVISSETGVEYLTDKEVVTYFILEDFEGPIFETISKTKHKILGPLALVECEKNGCELPTHNRPVFNYSMKGVVAAFSGVRKRDELTELVHLIHFMGGSIRKEMNHRATHLICPQAFGDKYRYALTFRLNVVRPSWVSDAWKKRHEEGFSAKNEKFSIDHRLKIFENCRVAFIGFPEHERVNMSNLLRSYNGVETTSDDETCTHKIIADCPIFTNECGNESLDSSLLDDTDCVGKQLNQQTINETINDLPTLHEEDENTKSHHLSDCKELDETEFQINKKDGVILKKEQNKEFSNLTQISPIPKESIRENAERTASKRQRIEEDTFDNISIDSTSISLSTKKPKLMRTASLTKNLRKSLSFGIMKTPINNMFGKSRRNSVDQDISASASMISMESTFNETITKPIKDKFRRMRDKASRMMKRDHDTPKSLKKDRSFHFGTDTANESKSSYFMNNSVSGHIMKTPEKGQMLAEPKTPRFLSDFQIPKDKNFAYDMTEKNTVVDDEQGKCMEDTKFFVLKAEWFWTRIAEGYAPEDDFLFKDYMKSIKDEHCSERRDSLINSSSKVQRKRKRLSRVVLESTPGSAGKRKSSTSDAGILSDSLIDYTASPDKSDCGKLNENISTEQSCKKYSMRRNHFMDFYHTESNYVGILETIMNLFKTPLEKMADENPDHAELLNKSELKSIFGNFYPIYEIHKKMLTRIQQINSNWTEECLIGEILMENRDRLLKAYPPYINFFEQMKATVIQCAQNKPRFQAFLKINQSKPECGRQTLQELMIRPVQRLPSISLLLNDILKHTPKTNPDHSSLVEALTSIKEVMTYINEDKRRTESQKQMFDIFNDIEGCPPMLVSSHRSLISKCEVIELEASDILSGRGDHLILFLFSDTLEICKKRSKANNLSKSPNSTYTGKHNGPKPYKHIKLIPLSLIRTVADISDSMRAFALSYRSSANIHDSSKDKICAFNIADEEIEKTMYIKNFCKQMAENACKADSNEFRVTVTSDEVNIDTSEVNLGTLSKAFRLATRTKLKVGRAFSFNKTPSRKRNVPLSPFGSNISLTPTISNMHQLKLQSSLNLNDIVPLSENVRRNQNSMDCED